MGCEWDVNGEQSSLLQWCLASLSQPFKKMISWDMNGDTMIYNKLIL